MWKLIESAPRDGSRFLASHAATGIIHISWQSKTSHVPLYGWCWNDGDPEDTDLWYPTHWMPLPEPPAGTP